MSETFVLLLGTPDAPIILYTFSQMHWLLTIENLLQMIEMSDTCVNKL